MKKYVDSLHAAKKIESKHKVLYTAMQLKEWNLFRALSISLNVYNNPHKSHTPYIEEHDDEPDQLDIKAFLDFAETAYKLTPKQYQAQCEEFLNTASVERWNNFYYRILTGELIKSIKPINFNSFIKQHVETHHGLEQYYVPMHKHQPAAEYMNQMIGDAYVEGIDEGKPVMLVLRGSTIIMYDGKTTTQMPCKAEMLPAVKGEFVFEAYEIDGVYRIVDAYDYKQYSKFAVSQTCADRFSVLMGMRDYLIDATSGQVVVNPKKRIDTIDHVSIAKEKDDLCQQGYCKMLIRRCDGGFEYRKTDNLIAIKL